MNDGGEYTQMPEGDPSDVAGGSPDSEDMPVQLDRRAAEVAAAIPTGESTAALGGRSQSTAERKRALRFVEEYSFQACIGACIALNIIVMAGETDTPDYEIWWYLENIFLIVFLLELILRILYKGAVDFITGSDQLWNFFETIIVLIGVCELWFMPLVGAVVSEDEPNGMQGRRHSDTARDDQSCLLRVLRLLRLLRLFRIFKIFQSLLKLAKAFREMMQSFFVIFAILFFFILFCAIICTQLLGQGEALDRDAMDNFDDLFPLVQMNFHDVQTSLFTLFQVTTTDNWMQIAEPVIALDERWMLFFVMFILFASWTMISVLTAVASDCMVMATNDRQAAELLEAEAKRKEFLSFLKEAFYESDADGSGTLDKQEFDDMIGNPQILNQIRHLGVAINRQDLLDAWGMLDIDGAGELTIDEFVTGLAYLQEGLSTKHIVDVEYQVKRVSFKTQKRIEKIKKFMENMKRLNAEVLTSLKTQETMDMQQLRALWLWKEWASKSSPEIFQKHAEVTARLRQPPAPRVGDAAPSPSSSIPSPRLQKEEGPAPVAASTGKVS